MTRQCKCCLHRIECFDKYYKWWWQRCKWYEERKNNMCDDERTSLNPSNGMTAEEAITKFKLIADSIEDGKQVAVPSVRFCELKPLSQMAISALEKQSKYAWHDLRKDPNDLPKSPTQVLTATAGFDYELGEYWEEQGGWGEVSSEVIAWKYIEPYEEAEE